MGGDSGNWEIIPYELHGPTSVREVELVANAGVTPAEAIEASTRLPGEMIGVSDEVGTLGVGKRADLVILAADPLTDLSAFTRPVWIVMDGEARTPAGWMTDGSGTDRSEAPLAGNLLDRETRQRGRA